MTLKPYGATPPWVHPLVAASPAFSRSSVLALLPSAQSLPPLPAQEDSPKAKRGPGRPRAGSVEGEGEDFWTALMPEAVEQYREAVRGRTSCHGSMTAA